MTDGQWTFVTNSRHGNNRSRLGSKHREKPRGQSKNEHNKRVNTRTDKHSSNKQQQSTYSSSRHPNYGPNHNTYSFPPNFDMANSFSPDSDISSPDISSGSVSPDITSSALVLPSYYIELTIECPFESCRDPNKPKVIINNSTYLVEHLRAKHKVHFNNLHHVYLILEKYLEYWAKQLTQGPAVEQLKTEISGDDDIHIIDPEKLPQDKNIRDQLQREKLNEVLQIQADERNINSKLQRKCLFCNVMCEN
ncbi:15748_t:CDS:2, partial [Acaulospora morrowiae]